MKNKKKNNNVVQLTIEDSKLLTGRIESENNLKSLFRDIRDYFAGNVTGISRDETIAQNIMRILFCKIFIELEMPSELLQLDTLDDKSLNKSVIDLFEKVKKRFPDLFDSQETIEVTGKDLSWIVKKLWKLDLLSADRDVVGDAFEELIGTSFRGGEGQFFTPRNVVEMMIEILSPKLGDRIIDPACGSGGFLAHSARFMLKNGVNDYQIIGIDKDSFLAKIARTYLSLLDPGKNKVYCENSLENPLSWGSQSREDLTLESFDIVLTNPPFGAKIPVTGREILSQYQLAYRWNLNDGIWEISKELFEKQPPQIIFIERCLQLLKPGGKMAIVLPEGIFGNPSDRYIWEYLNKVGRIDGIVSLAQETFQPSTHTKTSVLFFTKAGRKVKASDSLFMSIAENIGHNKNGKLTYLTDDGGISILDKSGNPMPNDDLPIISARIKSILRSGDSIKVDKLGYTIKRDSIHENIYIPEFYNPEILLELNQLEKSGKYRILTIGDLIKNKSLKISRGKEIGSNFYGTGNIPFVRTSDIVNWEIKFDPIKGVSQDVYNMFSKVMDIKEKDILFVNDGTFLIGRTAMITRLDLKILIQSHVRKLRLASSYDFDPFYLMYLMNLDIVQRQIKAKTFVQATISTIGNRLDEIKLPVHTNKLQIEKISKEVQAIITEKANLRERAMKLYKN
jgi:type I restriction enzyme M protein